jgi:acid stress-induced BolA-like protein IbaG/YrbA
MMFGSVSNHFADLQHVQRCKTCVSGLNALLQGTEVKKLVLRQKHLFHTIRPKVMFGSVSEHFANFLRVKRCKTCVLDLNALFRGT